MIDTDKAIQMRKDGKTYKEIATVFGVSHQRIQQKLRGLVLRVNRWSKIITSESHEQKAFNILNSMKLPVEIPTFQSECDLYVIGKPVEVKYISNTRKDKKIPIRNLDYIKALFLFIGDDWFFLPASKITKNMHLLYPYTNNSKYRRLLERYRSASVWQIRNVLLG